MNTGFEIKKPERGFYQEIIETDGTFYEIYDENGYWVASCQMTECKEKEDNRNM